MLLVVNAGSSSLKLAVFQAAEEVARASLGEIGEKGHGAALQAGLARMQVPVARLTGAAHRVVHGGAALTATCHVTPGVMGEIKACVPLAPLHNPANITGIEAVAALAPDLPQFAAFDTAFHATIPEVAATYALPPAERARGFPRDQLCRHDPHPAQPGRSARTAPCLPSWQRGLALRHRRRPVGCHDHGLFAA
jgi:acetate kinase